MQSTGCWVTPWRRSIFKIPELLTQCGRDSTTRPLSFIHVISVAETFFSVLLFSPAMWSWVFFTHCTWINNLPSPNWCWVSHANFSIKLYMLKRDPFWSGQFGCHVCFSLPKRKSAEETRNMRIANQSTVEVCGKCESSWMVYMLMWLADWCTPHSCAILSSCQ